MSLKMVRLFLLIWLCAVPSWGQVKVQVLLDQNQFLPGEAVPVKVRIINHSGQTLKFDPSSNWLRISLQAEDSFIVEQTGEVPATGHFELPPSKMATKGVDIEPYFTLSRPGRYAVVATVRIQEWNQTITSEPAKFDLIGGTKLWERAFGVPNSAQPDGSPEVRKYLLQQANHLRTQIQLYVRITDASEGRTYCVVPIGPIVSFSEPKALLDKDSNLHLLYQSGPRVSTYFAIDPYGKVLTHEMIEYSASRPRLVPAEDGSITVQGGIRMPHAPEESGSQESTKPKNDEG
ncbi:MAG: arrestin family protein [Verrucomicrobia bacterium]|nr:arrestin family protein [Verrucomicrobiota bacterium]